MTPNSPHGPATEPFHTAPLPGGPRLAENLDIVAELLALIDDGGPTPAE